MVLLARFTAHRGSRMAPAMRCTTNNDLPVFIVLGPSWDKRNGRVQWPAGLNITDMLRVLFWERQIASLAYMSAEKQLSRPR